MKKSDYVKLITDLNKLIGITATANDSYNAYALADHSVGLAFDETQAPEVVFILVDVGGGALNNDRELLEANAALPTGEDGYGCYARWPETDTVVYRAQWAFGPTSKADDLLKAISHVATRAVAGMPVAQH